MNDLADEANDNADAMTAHAIQSRRPTPEETAAFWRKVEEAERRMANATPIHIPASEADHINSLAGGCE